MTTKNATGDRRLPPVEPVEVPARLSQSLLARDDDCPRSAYLAVKHRGGPSSHEMDRGTLLHAFAARAMADLVRSGEPRLSEVPEQAASMTAAIVDECLRDMPELALPRREVDDVREMAYHWAVGYDVNPQDVAGLERLFVLDLDCGARVSGRMDVIVFPSAELGQVDDYKTSFALPTQGSYDESFQAWFYAMLLLYGRPVDVDTGELEEPIGRHLRGVWCREVYPRFLRDDGLLAHREVTVSRQAVADFRADVERQAERLMSRFASWEFPARAGSWCSRCPAAQECPLPTHLRDYAGTINSREQATEAWEKVLTSKPQLAAIEREVKNWSKAHGPIRVGDFEWSWEPRQGRAVRKVNGNSDWDGLEAAVQEAVTYGSPFELSQFVHETTSNSFVKTRVSGEEETA